LRKGKENIRFQSLKGLNLALLGGVEVVLSFSLVVIYNKNSLIYYQKIFGEEKEGILNKNKKWN